jgi:hypothetical protein
LVKWIKIKSPLALIDERLYRIGRFQRLAMQLAADLAEQKDDPISFCDRV